MRERQSFHHRELLQGDAVAGGDAGRKLRRRRFRAQTGAIGGLHRPGALERAHLGPNRLQIRPKRERAVPNRFMRHDAEMFGLRKNPRFTRGIHTRATRLLRR